MHRATILPIEGISAKQVHAMSKAVIPAEASLASTDLPEFLRVQKSGYLQAVGQSDAQNDRWTISLGNEAGGMPSI